MNNPSSGTPSSCVGILNGNVLVNSASHPFKNFNMVRRLAILAGATAFLFPALAAAQGSTVPARVTQRVDANRLVTLPGNTHPLARVRYDQGAAPADLPMNRVLLTLKRSAGQESALQTLLVQQQTKSSPNYHKWLTPDQFGQQFGPADTDIQAVTSWLASSGFQNVKVSRGRTVIEFSGTAAQIQSALHTTIHKYLVNGESHWANSADPSIPAALAPVVSGFVSIHDFRKKPASVISGRKAPLNVTADGKPQYTDLSDTGHHLAPIDFDLIYNVPPALTGSSVTIGVVARTNILATDISDFRSKFIPTGTGTVNIVPNGPDPGDLGSQEEGEAVLDASWSGAIAPGAIVDLVVSESTNSTDGIDLSEFYIIDNNLADVMTESFELCESQAGSSVALNFYGPLAEQAAAQGITDVVASGDGGPDACDDPSIAPATTTTPSVNVIASTPFSVAVGGTELHDCDPLPSCDAPNGPGTYWSVSSMNGPTGGSVLKYIPENVWNEGCPTVGPNCPAFDVGIWSSGGGESAFFTEPSWQSGVTGIPSGTARGRFVPDVSFAAADHDGYLLCLGGSCQGTGCPGGALVCYTFVSGTSVSAQVFGGIMALIDQKAGGRQGQADYALYKLAANEAAYPSSCNASTVPSPATLGGCIFNDVTSGNTNIPGESGFSATTGYDEATGLGSVNVTNLAQNWNGAVIQGSQTTLTISGTAPYVFPYAHPVTVTVKVDTSTVGAGTPTGDVSLIAQNIPGAANPKIGVDCNILPNTPVAQGGTGCGNVSVGNFQFIGSDSVSWSTTFLPGGTNYQLIAHYAGDSTFLGSDSAPATVTVNSAASTTRLGFFAVSDSACSNPLNSSTNSATYGSPYVLEVAVVDTAVLTNPNLQNGGTICSPITSGAAPTGTISLTDAGSPLPAIEVGTPAVLNSFGVYEDQLIPILSVGTHNVQAAYSGDNSFMASASNAPLITVVKAPTSASIIAPTSVAANASFQVTVFVDTATTSSGVGSVGANPTGTVTLTLTSSAAAFPMDRRWPGSSPFILAEMSAVIVCIALLMAVAKKRRGFAWLASAVILAIAVGASCGSGGGGGNNNLHTTTLGTANVTGTFDAGGFSAATVTFNGVMLSSGGTLNATYSGDSNYNGATRTGVAISVH